MQIFTRIPVNSVGASRWERVLTFFGHLDTRVFLTRDAFIVVGAGSLEGARRVYVVLQDHQGSVGRIGRHCDFANCAILSGGEHENDRPVNVGLGGAPVLRAMDPLRSGICPAPMIDIGNAVVISWGATVLPGVSVGDGAVIGAGSVVNRAVDPFAICAGVPARKLRERMDPDTVAAVRRVAWWNFAPAYLAPRLKAFQELAVTEGDHVYLRADTPRLVLTIAEGLANVRVLGVQYPDGGRLIERCSSEVQAYVEHAFGPGPYEWAADPLS